MTGPKVYVRDGKWVGPNMNFNVERSGGFNDNLILEDWLAWHNYIVTYPPTLETIMSLLTYDATEWNKKYPNYRKVT